MNYEVILKKKWRRQFLGVFVCGGLLLVCPSSKRPGDFLLRTYRQLTLGQDAVVCKDAELTGEITLGTSLRTLCWCVRAREEWD